MKIKLNIEIKVVISICLQQQTRHYNVTQAKYGKLLKTSILLIAWHQKFARQRQFRRITTELCFHIEFTCHVTHWIVCLFGRHFNHYIRAKKELRKIHPEYIVHD